jgi:hypothetical protein
LETLLKIAVMKNLLFLFAGLLMACNGSQKAVSENSGKAPIKPDPVAFAASITEEELKEHLYTYASDEFEGRETGKEGQKKAVAYLKAAYESMDIPGGLQGGEYFQNVPLELTKLPTGNLIVDGQSYANGEGFLTFDGSSRSYDQIVYVGYGIEAEEYSDYQDLDVKGKLLMMKAGEPRNGDGTFLLTGTEEPSKWSNISEANEKRMEVALEKGAEGILFVDPDNFSRYMRYFDYMKTNDSGQMSLKNKDEETPDMLLVSEELAGKIYDGYKSSEKPTTISLPVRMEVESRNEDVASENVVAFIRGSQWPEEYVVISSHLDHIGVNANGEINNGADDDGSGTVALLEIAEAFKQAADAGMGPRRSVVFLHVTGEEKGLLGSQYYTDVEPVFPLENTVANLNIDMIGRIDPKREGNRNYVYLIGSDKLSSELHELSETVNSRYTGIELDYTYNDENDPNRFYYRSDHYNFAKNNIPIIFYFNGTHADYHRPGDTPDKINYDLLKNRTQLVFHTAWEIANRDSRLVVDQVAR